MNPDQSDALADTCVRCGYDLRGIENDQPCPECGLLAERSRRPSERLRDSRPGYLRKLSIGLSLVVIGCLVPFVWTALIAIAELADVYTRIPFFNRNPTAFGFVGELGALFGGILIFVGVWMLTAAETVAAGVSRGRWQRALRWFALIPILYSVTLLLQQWVYHLRFHALTRVTRSYYSDDVMAAYQPYLDAMDYIAYAFFPLAVIPLPAILFAHLAWLGKRLLSRQLAEHSVIVGIGLSVTIALMAVTAALFNNAEELFGRHWASRSDLSMATLVICSTVAALFALWSLYLVIRFAIAFAVEGRALKRLWRDADRSAVVRPAAD